MKEHAGLLAHIESLVFDERVDDARALFEEHAASLAVTDQVTALTPFVRS